MRECSECAAPIPKNRTTCSDACRSRRARRVDRERRGAAAPKPLKAGWVYFVYSDRLDMVKIGVTTRPPAKRIRDLQVPGNLQVLRAEHHSDVYAAEAWYHWYFGGGDREWFVVEGEMAELVEASHA